MGAMTIDGNQYQRQEPSPVENSRRNNREQQLGLRQRGLNTTTVPATSKIDGQSSPLNIAYDVAVCDCVVDPWCRRARRLPGKTLFAATTLPVRTSIRGMQLENLTKKAKNATTVVWYNTQSTIRSFFRRSRIYTETSLISWFGSS